MTIGEFAGYTAALLVFITFYMKTIVPLQLVGILSNLAFITYSLLEFLTPVLILHAALLPLNIIRLRQIMVLTRDVQAAADGNLSLEALAPLMARQRVRAGEVLFRKDDLAEEIFYVRRGVVHLPELDRHLSEGAVFGEIGLFSPGRTRTTTAICETDGELLRLSETDLFKLFYQSLRIPVNVISHSGRR